MLENFRNRTRMMDRHHLPRSTVSLKSYFQSLTPLKFDNETAQTHVQGHASDKSSVASNSRRQQGGGFYLQRTQSPQRNSTCMLLLKHVLTFCLCYGTADTSAFINLWKMLLHPCTLLTTGT